MNNGNPKLTCNDETCCNCQQVFAQVVQPLPRMRYVCETCVESLLKETHKTTMNELRAREALLQKNRDFIAQHLGWKQVDEKSWKHENKNIVKTEHPVFPSLATAISLVPHGWEVKFDDIQLIAFKRPQPVSAYEIETQYMDMLHVPSTIFYSSITGETEEFAKMHDYFNLVVKIIKSINHEE